MQNKLSFKLLPHEPTSDYDWMNIDCDDIRVGKVRGLIIGKRLTIFSIMIFPEFEGHGYARQTIDMFKTNFDTIIADRVRYTAIRFWEKMDFESINKENYIWKSKQ